jgi:hypothetical protein
VAATRQSWTNLQPMPPKRASLELARSFTAQEYERIRLGFVPESMEDKWFMFTEADTLYIYRSWTGHCIYELHFTRQGERYTANEIFANRDQSQYTSLGVAYDERLLTFLIESLLLGERSPLPLSKDLPAGTASELHLSHIVGAGQRSRAETQTLTPGDLLRWIWNWVRWLLRR